MKNKRQKRSIKIVKEANLRKKYVSPKLDIFKPAHAKSEKKYLALQNKIKNQSKTIEKIPKNLDMCLHNETKQPQNCYDFINKKNKINNFINNGVEKNCSKKYDSDYQLQSKLNGSQRSTSLGKLGDSGLMGSLYKNKGDSQTLRKEKPIRFQKFAFRSQKYIKLNSQIKKLNDEDYNQKIQNLKQDIEYYKNMYLKSIKAMLNIDNIIENEKEKFDLEKKFYEQQIKKLRNKKQTRKPFIGHLYSYKQFLSQQIFPSDIIMQKSDQNYVEKSKFSFTKQKGQQLINKYLDKDNQNQQIHTICLSRLSVQSK